MNRINTISAISPPQKPDQKNPPSRDTNRARISKPQHRLRNSHLTFLYPRSPPPSLPCTLFLPNVAVHCRARFSISIYEMCMNMYIHTLHRLHKQTYLLTHPRPHAKEHHLLSTASSRSHNQQTRDIPKLSPILHPYLPARSYIQSPTALPQTTNYMYLHNTQHILTTNFPTIYHPSTHLPSSVYSPHFLPLTLTLHPHLLHYSPLFSVPPTSHFHPHPVVSSANRIPATQHTRT